MAEAIAIVGVVAAAAQFIDTGSRLVSHLISLCSRIRDSPRCLELTRDEVQMLLGLAELTEKRITAENSACLPPVSQSLQSDQAPTLQSSQSSPLIWLESVWRSCTAQACELDGLLRQMLPETECSTFRKGWRKLCTLKNEEDIERILTRIERSKTLLSIWYGQECLDRMNFLNLNLVDLRGEVSEIRQSMAHSRQAFEALLPAQALESHGGPLGALQQDQYSPTCPSNRCVLDMIQKQGRQSFQTWQQVQSLTTVIQEVRSDIQTLSMSRARTARSKESDMYGSEVVSANTMSASALEFPVSSRPSRCKCISFSWHKVYCFSTSSRLMGQYCSNISNHCPLHRKRKRSSDIAIRFRQQVPFTVTMLEGTLQICQSSLFPSVGISLRTEARVKVLPLESFFRKLYNCHLRVETTSRYQDPIERQDYLLSVAQKMLQHSFSSGEASPDDVDSQGRTLLHQQIELYWQGDERFVARMVRLLLSMGVRADILNDQLCTAQQALANKLAYYKYNARFLSYPLAPIGDELLDWTGCRSSDVVSVSGILDCIIRWPESISDWGYPTICDIVLRRSINDLNDYLKGSAPAKEWTARQLTPLHFATAADWLEGVKILLESGADEYAQDSEGLMALDVAISIQSACLVKALLASDIKPYLYTKRERLKTTLGWRFLLAAKSSNKELQDVVVNALARERGQLYKLRPFHDLATIQGSQARLFAEKLYSAGFQDLEQYDESGMTPLIFACCQGRMSMASFLLSYGAKLSTEHRDAALRPGHFLTYGETLLWGYPMFGYRSGNELHHGEETRLLEAAFKSANRIDSICRCSPDGFSPLTAVYRRIGPEQSHRMKQSFETMLNFLNPQYIDISRQWRCLVALEVFDRLEMTHTCIRHLPTVCTFPEEDRIEIEEEEEEIFVEFQSIMDEYDQFRKKFNGAAARCVEEFFDKLDHDLRPSQDTLFDCILYCDKDVDLLGPGPSYQKYWISTNGQRFAYGHDEGAGESSLLGSLFD